MRVTKRMIEVRLGAVNRQLERMARSDEQSAQLDINYASIYGGYQLTSAKGSHIVAQRMPAKEMLQYLDGMLTGFNLAEGAYR